MFILHLLFSFFLGLSPLTIQSQADYLEEEKLVENFVAEGVVGISAGYSIDGEIKWKTAKGFMDRDKEVLFQPNTLSRTASIAKPMTSVAIMQLVEQGKLDLDVQIQTYLPDYPVKKKGTITIRHLLNHTSGIPGYKNGKERQNQKQFDNLWDASQVFAKRKLQFEPGTAFSYTTYGYVVLGAIIEEVTGQKFEEFMKNNIWTPLGMNDTGVEVFGKSYLNKSQLYHFEKGKARDGKQNNLSNRIPGGGFYTTLEDLLKFGNAILDNTLVDSTTLEEMVKIPDVDKEGNPYGFGWKLYGPTPYENLVIGHNGEQTGVSSQILINRKRKSVVVVLSNTSGKSEAAVGLAVNLMHQSYRHTE